MKSKYIVRFEWAGSHMWMEDTFTNDGKGFDEIDATYIAGELSARPNIRRVRIEEFKEEGEQ